MKGPRKQDKEEQEKEEERAVAPRNGKTTTMNFLNPKPRMKSPLKQDKGEEEKEEEAAVAPCSKEHGAVEPDDVGVDGHVVTPPLRAAEPTPSTRGQPVMESAPGAFAVEGPFAREADDRHDARNTVPATVSISSVGDDSNSGLVTARPVDEEEPHEIPQATALAAEEEDVPSKEDRTMYAWAPFVVTAVAVAGFIGAVVATLVGMKPASQTSSQLTSNSSSPVMESSASTPPTSAPTTWTESWTQSLPPFTLQAIQEDLDSPQFRAYEWLLRDPHLRNYTDWKLQQRLALATLYYATEGEDWFSQDDWLDYEVDECHWQNRLENPNTTCDEHGRYQELALPKNNLAGRLPPELALLGESLTFLYLKGNEIRTIPTELFSSLTNLRYVNMDLCSLTGTFPTELGLWTNLEHIEISSNEFHGTIPTELGNLVHLRVLRIAYLGSVTGSVPTELFRYPEMQMLHIHGNSGLSGKNVLPSEIGTMTKLDRLICGQVPFQGSIPCK
jgi:hypothetical protein